MKTNLEKTAAAAKTVESLRLELAQCQRELGELRQSEGARAEHMERVNLVLRRNTSYLTETTDLPRFLGSLLKETLELLDADGGHIFIYHKSDKSFSYAAGGTREDIHLTPTANEPGFFRGNFPAHKFPVFERLRAVRHAAILSRDGKDAPPPPELLQWFQERGFVEGLCLVLTAGEIPVGFIGVVFRKQPDFSVRQMDIFHALANQAALAIHLSNLADVAKEFALSKEKELAAKSKAADLENEIQERNRQLAELKKAEQDLRRSEAYLAEAQRLSLTGSFGWNVATGELVWSDETFCILGYDVTVKPTLELVFNRVHPADIISVRRILDQGTREQINLDFEHRLLMPDGSVKHVHVVARAAKLESGVVEFVGAVMDVTAQKRLENQLRQSEQNLAEGQRLTKTGSWILDYHTGNTDWSVETCRIFGFPDPPPSPHYSEFRARVRPEDREGVDRGLRESFETGEPRPLKYIFILPDGVRKKIETISQPVKDENGAVLRLMGTVMDVTERTQAAEALHASENLARGQVEALKSTMDALAMEASPDRLVEHVLRTIITQLGAHGCSVWQRVGVSDLIGFEFSFEDGKFVTKSDLVLAGITVVVMPMEEFWAWPEVVRMGKPGVIEDIRELPFFRFKERLISLGVITILVVPMTIAGRVDAVIGVRFTQKRVFSADELELAQALANQAMLVMQLTRLSAESRESAVIEERNRMARDIHDTLAQGFTGVIMQLEAAKGATVQGNLAEAANRIERANDLARSSLGEARRSVRALRPRSLRAGKLFLALDDLLKRMAEGTNLNAEFQAEGDEGSIPPDYEEGLLRITQEALTNAVKHANARNFKATLRIGADKIQLLLVDDGRGFDPQKEHDGFGLIGMKERVDRMGGEFMIRTKQSVGTEILVVLKQQSALKPENGNE
jgi:PAS domain S-box-containing protein